MKPAATNFDWRAESQALADSTLTAPRRPLIGITGNFGAKGCELAEGYFLSVHLAGGSAVVIPPLDSALDIETLLDRLDGLIFSGGGDIDPRYLGEPPSPTLCTILSRRDHMEILLMRRALDRNIPMLCICRGIQLLAVVTGGSILQDIAEHSHLFPAPPLNHTQTLPRTHSTHIVRLEEGTLMARLVGATSIVVNSIHHQAVARPGEALVVSGRATDGVIEAIESRDHKPVLGVQWHPEAYILAGSRRMLPLFSWLCTESTAYRRARSLHLAGLTLDSHCDTPMLMERGIDFTRLNPEVRVSLPLMSDGILRACVMAAYLPQGPLTPEGYSSARDRCDRLLTLIERQVSRSTRAVLAQSPEELLRHSRHGRFVILKAIENGYALGHNLENIPLLARRGVTYITLCHNGDNDICDSAVRSLHTHGGLSPFGRELIPLMNRAGIIIDLSHAGDDTFRDVLALSTLPVLCTHSSCRPLCPHPRNLTDDQFRRLAGAGGVCQINAYRDFLRPDPGRATVADLVRHILHAISIAGIEHVGIGSDFDGGGGVPGFETAADCLNLTRLLLREGLTPADLSLLWGGNFLRVYTQNYSHRTL